MAGTSGLLISNETDFVLGPSGEQLTEMGNGGTTWVHTNVFVGGELFASYDPNGLHFYANDWLGNRRVQTDYAGVPEQACTNSPFGDNLSCSQSLTTPTEHHFTGKERDAESGNDYFEARYYASSMGRFLSPDWSAQEEPVPYAKMDDPQSLNLYAYVRNNPLTRVDADGHDGCCEITWNDVQTGFEVAGAAVTAAEAGVVALGAAAFGGAAYSAAQGNSPYLTNGYPTSFNLNPTSSNAAPAPQPAGEQSTPASPGPDGPYKRPNNATTQEQRDSVQGKPCATCGASGQKNNADHKEPLVEQHYKGGVDKSKMHSTDAVQPQCASCSNQQGGLLSGFSKAMKKLFGF